MYRTVPLLLSTLFVVAAAAVPFSSLAAQEADTPPVVASAAEELPPILKSGSGECQTLYEGIRNAHDILPKDMTGISKSEAERLAAVVKEMADAARRFEDECPDADALQLAERGTAPQLRTARIVQPVCASSL